MILMFTRAATYDVVLFVILLITYVPVDHIVHIFTSRRLSNTRHTAFCQVEMQQ